MPSCMFEIDSMYSPHNLAFNYIKINLLTSEKKEKPKTSKPPPRDTGRRSIVSARALNFEAEFLYHVSISVSHNFHFTGKASVKYSIIISLLKAM